MLQRLKIKLKINKNVILKACIAIVFLIGFTVTVIFVNQDNPGFKTEQINSQFAFAKVTDVISESLEPSQVADRPVGTQELEIQILSGEHKGEVLSIKHYLSVLSNIHLKPNSKVIVRLSVRDNGSYEASVYSFNRVTVLTVFSLLFILTLCLVGGKKGIMATLGIAFTVVCIVFILLPAIYKGYDPILMAMIIVVITSIVCFVLIAGFSRKTLSAIMGTFFGVAVSGILTATVSAAGHLNGFNMEEAESMLLQANDLNLKIGSMLTAGIIIAASGAVMDVAMAISSAVNEIHELNPEMKPAALYKSGMNIGKDAMGTMSNTLILAFIGSSLNFLVLVFAFGIPFLQLINTDSMSIEIVKGIACTMGLVLTNPIVALVSAYITQIKFKGELL